MKFPRMKKKELSGILANKDIDLELLFVTEVLKLQSLHYGYWDSDPGRYSLSLSEIRNAQARYTERLMSFVPSCVECILDVGAGIGDNALALAKKGFKVHSLSPDENHRQYFTQMDEDNITFTHSRYEEFDTNEKFDLVLFSESHNYFDAQVGLSQTRRFLNPKGILLLSGMFRMPDRSELPTGFEIIDHPYFEHAKEEGFITKDVVDITEQVLPTMKIVNQALKDYVDPLAYLAHRFLQNTSPWKSIAFDFLAGKEISKLEKVRDYYLERTAPEYFEKRIRYGIVTLELASPL